MPLNCRDHRWEQPLPLQATSLWAVMLSKAKLLYGWLVIKAPRHMVRQRGSAIEKHISHILISALLKIHQIIGKTEQ